MGNKESDLSPPNEQDFESSLNSIEALVTEIENGKLPLDQIVGKFKLAIEQITRCRNMLNSIEQQIQVLEQELTEKP